MDANAEGAGSGRSLAATRREYRRATLSPEMLHPDPLVQFQAWLSEALEAGLDEPNAMALATATALGRPSLRIVLLKQVDERGFVFFTNYDSTKGRQLAENPHAALDFHWPQLERQVAVTGTVERLPPGESDAYFHSRPLGSQLGAAASRQSSVLADRTELETRVERLRAQFAERPVPRPPQWGGLRVVPDCVEFWQGRADRLHDRLRYRRHDGAWTVERLSP